MNKMAKSNLWGMLRIAALRLAAIATAGLVMAATAIIAAAADGDVVPTFAPQLVRGGAVSQIFIQPDGKILLMGEFTTVNGTLRPYLARLNADGTIDPSFVPLPLGRINSIVLQPDGKILIRGTPIRLNSDGSRDTGFQPAKLNYAAALPNGKIAVNDSPSGYMTGLSLLSPNGALEVDDSAAVMGNVVYIAATAPQADGKVIFAGNFFSYRGAPRPGLARMDAEWSLDPTFPAGSATVPNFPYVIFSQIAPLADGRIFVMGNFTRYDGVARPGLARLDASGKLDASFDPPATNGLIYKLVPLSDGGLLIAGTFTTVGGAARSRIARLKPDGSLDADFDPGAEFNGFIGAVGVQADGKVVIGGDFTRFGNTTRLGIARLNPDGSLDATFTPSTASTEFVRVKFIRRTADGKFVIAGDFNQVSGVQRPGLARLNADGSLDAGFAPAGMADPNLVAVEVLPNGKLILASNTNSSRQIFRLNADGSADATFPNASFAGTIRTLVVQADGRLLIGGWLNFSSSLPPKLMVARLNPDGTPDATFNFVNEDSGFISAVSPLADGKIMVGGRFGAIGGVVRRNLARLNSNGTVDSSFYLTVDDTGVPDIQFTPYLGGKILVSGGFSMLAGAARRRMALLNGDGSPDAAFVPALGLNPQAVSVLPDGRILVTEGSEVMRLNADGSPDFAFSFPVWLGAGDAKGTTFSLLALPDGRAITGGGFYQAGVARTVRPLLAMFEAGGPMIRLPAAGVASAANYRPAVAGGSIISVFGTGLAASTVVARTNPLPTGLGGVRVRFLPTESGYNDDLLLPLFFVSERQINCWMQYLFPNEGYLLVEKDGVVVAAAAINAVRVAPGIFTADASGKGYPAAQVVHVRANGSQTYEPVVTRNADGQLIGRPIDLGPEGDLVYLVLYGTGASGGVSKPIATATIGEAAAQIQYLGQAPSLIGVDQINLLIPRSLKGINKDVDVKLTVDGSAANTVKINIQ